MSGSAGSAGISITFCTACPLRPPFPPLRCHTQIEDDRSLSETTTPTKPYALRRIVRRAQFQHHLLLGPKIQRLQMAPPAQVPEVQSMAVLPPSRSVGFDAVLRPCSACPTRW